MATIEEYHAFFETLWKGAKMDELEARRALREWVKEHEFTLYDMGLTMYEYHDEDEDGEEEYEPEQWEREKARREALRIYEQHVGLLGDYIMLERNRMNRESILGDLAHPAWRLVRFEDRATSRDWMTRWSESWEKVAGEGACKNEMVAMTTSPIWKELSVFGLPYPPFDYNSGMDVLPVDRDEAEAMGLTVPSHKRKGRQ